MTYLEFQRQFAQLVGTHYPIKAVEYIAAGYCKSWSVSLRCQSLLWEFRLICRRLSGSIPESEKRLAGLRLVILSELEKIKPSCDNKEWEDCYQEVRTCLERAISGGTCGPLPKEVNKFRIKETETRTFNSRLEEGFRMMDGEPI